MWKHIRRVLMIVLAVIFLFCGGTVAVVQHQYNVSKRLYRAASAEFTESTALGTQKKNNGQPEKTIPLPNDGIYRLPEKAPIKVNFEELKKVNTDVDGWIYCPGTVIDYPVMHSLSNDTYLHHSYDGTYNASGSIFIDERNQRNYADPVTILYGHHMASGAMFATLDWWQVKSYYDEHPVMWLLTETQDYKVELYSAYNCSAYGDSYMIPPYSGEDTATYITKAASHSQYPTEVVMDPNAHYIMMSTCAYIFEEARSVLHGKLVPVMSAGGIPMV